MEENLKDIKNKKFQHVVGNAIDFLQKSISELEHQPKYSVINFHAAIELFLKARLMAEHWTLAVSSKKEPDWNGFVSGAFVSVSLEEAAKRLDKVVQSSLSDKQLAAFRTVTKHRNQMVHFFHESESKEAGQKRIQAIVKEQLTAWYFLHDLLLNQWKDIFLPWEKELLTLDKDLRQHHEFLRVIFNELKPELDNLIGAGYKFQVCPSCGFKSEKHINELDELYESNCLVCGLSANCIQIKCSECDKGSVCYRNEPYAICSNCEHVSTDKELLSKFYDDGAAFLAVKDGGEYPFPISCGECTSSECVVEVSEEEYLCTQCFDVSDSYRYCEWCGDASTSMIKDTFWSGCEYCDGRAGWEK